MTDFWDMDFTDTGCYDVIYNHILVHKYYINQDKTEEIPFHEAIISWYNQVYTPIIKIIEKYKVLKSFKGRTNSDLYVWIVKHWDNLKSIYGLEYPLNEAALDFKQKYGVTKAEYIKLFLQAFFKRKK